MASRTAKHWAPPEDFGIPISFVERILGMDLWVARQDRAGYEKRCRDYLREKQTFAAYREFEWASGATDGAMIHVSRIRVIPGFQKLTAEQQQQALMALGIQRYGGYSRHLKVASRYVSIRDVYPPLARSGETTVVTMAEGIRLLRSEKEICRDYSRDAANAILMKK